MNAHKPLVILGAGGHAKVLLALVQSLGLDVLGVCDPVLAEQGAGLWRGIAVLGGDAALEALDPDSVELVNGLGQLVGSAGRANLFQRLKLQGFRFPVLVHPTAWVDSSATLQEGVQVMAGAVIQADVVIGANSIINTRAGVDHDCRLGVDVHVAPGATLCGSVRVADRAFIGSGATVIQGLNVGMEAVVGAGATLTRNLEARHVLLGPAGRKKDAPKED
ncbi:acetyltransferase [Pseudomonas sp. MYb118]|uniref:acetyltransferase n=1 Tax=Pseudomonas sp. MYb118 TaxID=1848720 RepID=UPI0034CFD86C